MGQEPRIARGDEGQWVQYLQQTLEYQGFPMGAADGRFSEDLESTVIRFQSARGLTADGVVDEQTWDALVRGASPGGPVPAEVDERLQRFDINDYPLLVEMSQYGEGGEEGFRQFLAARGVDTAFVDAMLAGDS